MGLDLAPLLATLTIRDKFAQTRPLELNWAQRPLVDYVELCLQTDRPCRIIVDKARQLGISTAVEALLFVWALRHNTNSLVIADERGNAEVLFDKTKLYYESWPYRSGYPVKYYRRNQLTFERQGSNIWVMTAENTEAGRSRTVHACHASEVAFWSDPTATMTALAQCVPNLPGTLMVVESTANGVGNWFEETWSSTCPTCRDSYLNPDNQTREHRCLSESDFRPFFFPWWRHPEYIPCEGAFCLDGSCDRCQQQCRTLRPRDQEERDLIKRFRIDRPHLAWRRYAIPNRCSNSIDLFHQEFPSCLVGDCRVGTEKGMLRIDEISDASETAHGRIVKDHQQPPSPVYRLTTEMGYTITGTADHPVAAPDRSLTDLVDLQLGDPVALFPPRMADELYVERWWLDGIDHSVTITPEWGRLLGLFMADGSVYRQSPSGKQTNTISIACDGQDPDVIEESVRLLKVVLGVSGAVRRIGGRHRSAEVRGASAAACRLLERLGAVEGNRRKVCVPECIWRSPRDVVREFLRGYFEGDGFNGYKYPRVNVFCKHWQMLHDVQLLLLAFGITAQLTERPTRNGSGYEYAERMLHLRGEEARAFNDRIGFLSERKQGRICRPPSKIGRPQKKLVLADKVASVEEVGEAVTYNLTIESEHLFDANGILTHNTPEESFIFSGVNAFPEPSLKAVYEPLKPATGFLVRDPANGQIKFRQDVRGPLRIFRWPSKDTDWGQYFVGADPSYGHQDSDYAAAQVINRRNREQVAVFEAKVNPYAFADELTNLGHFYNQAVISVEVEGGGVGTITKLIDQYPHLWRHTLPDRDHEHRKSWSVYGWSTNWKRKAWAITNLAERIEANQIVLHDERTFRQMRGYTFYGNKAGHDPFEPGDKDGADDLVMALAICNVCESSEAPVAPYESRSGVRSDGVIWPRELEETGAPWA